MRRYAPSLSRKYRLFCGRSPGLCQWAGLFGHTNRQRLSSSGHSPRHVPPAPCGARCAEAYHFAYHGKTLIRPVSAFCKISRYRTRSTEQTPPDPPPPPAPGPFPRKLGDAFGLAASVECWRRFGGAPRYPVRGYFLLGASAIAPFLHVRAYCPRGVSPNATLLHVRAYQPRCVSSNVPLLRDLAYRRLGASRGANLLRVRAYRHRASWGDFGLGAALTCLMVRSSDAHICSWPAA